MRCKWCKKTFTQIEARKAVTAHQQEDGSTALNIPVENKTATGPLLWAAHYKEYKEHDKREKRGGNSATGSSLGAATPSAYTMETGMDTQAITDRQQLKRSISEELGVDSENWRVAEVMRRRDHGDKPYDHTHERPMEAWRVAFHMLQAHGVDLPLARIGLAHQADHIRAARDGEERKETDWHDSIDIDL